MVERRACMVDRMWGRLTLPDANGVLEVELEGRSDPQPAPEPEPEPHTKSP